MSAWAISLQVSWCAIINLEAPQIIMATDDR
jgi:hypothetical protein